MKAIRTLLTVFCFISLTEKFVAQENTVTSRAMPAAVSASDEDFRAVMKAIRKERNQKKLRIGIVTQGMIGAHFTMATAIKEALEAEFGEKCEVEICDNIISEISNKYYKKVETKSGIKRTDIM